MINSNLCYWGVQRIPAYYLCLFMHVIQRQSSQVFLNFIHQDYSTFHTVMKNYVEDPDVELNVVHIGAFEKKWRILSRAEGYK